MKQMILCVALAWLYVLAGCGRTEAPPVAVPVDSHLALQQEMMKGGMDFSRVVIVRLISEGKRVVVTSILPAVIAEAQVGGQTAMTIFRLNEAGNALVMFSRDVPRRTSSRVEVSFADLESRKGVMFPVVAADGSLKEREFKLERVVVP